jgi:hypothetical protein
VFIKCDFLASTWVSPLESGILQPLPRFSANPGAICTESRDYGSKMFENNLLNKLTDAIPSDVKEKVMETVKEKLSGKAADLKSSAMEQLGFTKPVASEGLSVTSPAAEAASAPSGDETADLIVDQPDAEEAEGETNTSPVNDLSV